MPSNLAPPGQIPGIEPTYVLGGFTPIPVPIFGAGYVPTNMGTSFGGTFSHGDEYAGGGGFINPSGGDPFGTPDAFGDPAFPQNAVAGWYSEWIVSGTGSHGHESGISPLEFVQGALNAANAFTDLFYNYDWSYDRATHESVAGHAASIGFGKFGWGCLLVADVAGAEVAKTANQLAGEISQAAKAALQTGDESALAALSAEERATAAANFRGIGAQQCGPKANIANGFNRARADWLEGKGPWPGKNAAAWGKANGIE